MSSLVDIISGFVGKRILVVGDVMLDKYVFCEATRISPEAPVPIVEVKNIVYGLGGAANTAANIKSLGGGVYLVGIVGNDENGTKLKDQLYEIEVSPTTNLVVANRKTTIKERIIANNQQLLRVDDEDREYLSEDLERLVRREVMNTYPLYDAVVVSDYAKGVITKSVMDTLLKYSKSKGIPVIVDPRPKNKLLYKNCDFITPNIAEAKAMVGDFEYVHLCKRIMEELNCKVLLTKGEEGMTLYTKEGGHFNFDAITKGVHDVTGAGDTAVAVLALSLAAGASYDQAAQLANYAAGIVVTKLGCATTTRDELVKIINEYKT